jgi:hypothetical protein
MMTYTATFHAGHAYAVEQIEAATAEQALTQAQALYDNDPSGLDWCAYDPDCKALRAIDIESVDETDGTIWQSADAILKDAARHLLEALETYVDDTEGRFGEIPDDMTAYHEAVAIIAKTRGD